MLTILNRREVFITFDKNRQSEIRHILNQNGIDYDIKTVRVAGRGNTVSTSLIGDFGIKQDYVFEYHIYVAKDNYDQAKYLINKG